MNEQKLNKEHFSLYSTTLEPTLKRLLTYEIKSLLGRILKNKKPPKKKDINLLNLGCGSNHFEDWVNADFFCCFKFWGKESVLKPDWMLDLRYSLNCDNNYWNGIFTEHALEHLCPYHAKNLLNELFRTLKPGSWIRIIVPDLNKYIDYYVNPELSDPNFFKFKTGAEAIRSLTQNHMHRSTWDAELLGIVLKECGYRNIKEVSFGEGTDNSIIKDNNYREWNSLYMEAQKPII